MKLDKEIIIQKEISIDQFEIIKYQESRSDKWLECTVYLYKKGEIIEEKSYILWRGEEYDQIGQWTDDDAINRLKEILDKI